MPRTSTNEILNTLRATAIKQIQTTSIGKKLLATGVKEADLVELAERIVRNQAQIVDNWIEEASEHV